MKTSKLFFMAALSLLMAACSNDDNEVAKQQAEQPDNNMITITAQLAPKSSNAKTRAVTDDGTNIVVDWAVDEHLAILYEVSSTKYAADARVTAVDGSGNATIEFNVEGGTADNTTCTLVYPYDAAKDDHTGVKDAATLLAAQDGTLSANLDVRVGAGTIQTTTPGLTVTTQPEAQFAIFKFTLQDLSAAAKSATEFKVSDGSGNVITTVTPGSATGTLYVGLPALATGTYWFNATIDSKPYIAKATVGTATTAGKYYQSTVKMATFGDFILDDGKFAPSSSTGTKVAMIAYVGSDNGESSPYNHGLALALNDAGSFLEWSRSNTKIHTYNPTSSSFTSESGLQYKDATHNSNAYPAFKAAFANNSTAAPTGCSAWFLASGYQWNKMVFAADSYVNLRTNAGLQSGVYWSSTEFDAYQAWIYSFGDGNWYDDGFKDDDYEVLVRSCLAF